MNALPIWAVQAGNWYTFNPCSGPESKSAIRTPKAGPVTSPYPWVSNVFQTRHLQRLTSAMPYRKKSLPL